ncbi:MAG: UDP-N-acetylmuramoyl-L-alanyl-D-glutamate--2,6-diaminopimelate ligase [Ferrimicrobium sp.]
MGENRIERGVLLSSVAAWLPYSRGAGALSSTVVTGIAMDHRQLEVGDIFAVVPGTHFDPTSVIEEARGLGARALLVPGAPLEVAMPQIVVAPEEIRPAVAAIAQRIYGSPSTQLSVIGVTGTNGKTTTVYLIAEILRRLGSVVGTIGTLWGRLTTPESPELARRLAGFVEEGAGYAAMEVSSIALAMHRVDGLHLVVGVFTNLSQDHLDFHGSMEEYFLAKASLFTSERCEVAVINGDDPWGQRLASLTKVPARIVSEADLELVHLSLEGLRWSYQGVNFSSRLLGHHNLANLRAAVEVVHYLGYRLSDIAEVLREIPSPLGRLQRVPTRRGTVFVDYAHSPAALRQALAAARLSVKPGGRLVVVFGAGGERDHGKRPRMGAVAEAMADSVIVTNDNPRSEEPSAIAADIVAGVRAPERIRMILDRREAIQRAVMELEEADTLVVAGKGHERKQYIEDFVIDFDDVRVVLEAGGIER